MAVSTAFGLGTRDVSVSLIDDARLDLEHRCLSDLVRASVHNYNTDAELDLLIESLPTRR